MEIFNVEGNDIRFGVTADGRPYAVATDYAKAMGYRDAADAVRLLDGDEYGQQVLDVRTDQAPDQGTTQIMRAPERRRMSVIYEDGLWELIFRSTLPGAKAIKKRVKEILREIRETGGYGVKVPQSLPEALRAFAAEVEAREAAERQVAEERSLRERTEVVMNDAIRSAVQKGRALAIESARADENENRARLWAATIEPGQWVKSAILMKRMRPWKPGLGQPLGPRQFFGWLRDNEMIYRNENVPMQPFVNRGWMRLIPVLCSDGEYRDTIHFSRKAEEGIAAMLYVQRYVLLGEHEGSNTEERMQCYLEEFPEES
jgi:prophage antirepressor-like protein